MNIFRIILVSILLAIPSPNVLASDPDIILNSDALNKNNLETLNGDWWFAWDRHLTPEQAVKYFHDNSLTTYPVPAYWREYLASDPDNQFLHGTASFLTRLRVSKPVDIPLSLKVPIISDAYEIYWIPLDAPDQWVEVAREGRIGSDFLPAMRNLDHPLPPIHDGLLLINVRSELFEWAGLITTLSIGPTKIVKQQRFIHHLTRGILIGALVLIILQNLLLYFYSRKESSALVLATLSLVIAARSLFLTGAMEYVFSEDIHVLRMHLEYITVLLPGTLALQFHNTLIPGFIHPLVIRCSWAICVFFSLLTLVIPTDVMSSYLYGYQAFLGLNIIAIIVGLIRAVWLDLKYARIIAAGSLIILLGAVNDMMAANIEGYSFVFSDYAFILFMFVQSQVVGRQINAAVLRARRLATEKKALEKAHRAAVKSSMHDHLTGLLNRQAFDESYLQAWDKMKRHRLGLSVVLFDIDHFKGVNDTYGHLVGDEVLMFISKLLKNFTFRKEDFVCRYGGEEFVLVLPATTIEDACILAEKIRIKIMTSAAGHVADEDLFVSCSFGVAMAEPSAGHTPLDLIKSADDALYEAKEMGRNCVIQKYA